MELAGSTLRSEIVHYTTKLLSRTKAKRSPLEAGPLKHLGNSDLEGVRQFGEEASLVV